MIRCRFFLFGFFFSIGRAANYLAANFHASQNGYQRLTTRILIYY